MLVHNEKSCHVCKIIKEEEQEVKKIQKINEIRREQKLQLLDDGSSIPSHCCWCYNQVVWDGDHWCSEKCYDLWKKWYDMK